MRVRTGREIARQVNALIADLARFVVIDRRLVAEALGKVLIVQAVKIGRCELPAFKRNDVL